MRASTTGEMSTASGLCALLCRVSRDRAALHIA